MALSFMIRRASSSPALPLPLAIRAVGSPRTFHKAISNILNSSEPVIDSKDTIQVVKKRVDDNLLRVIDTEIKSKEYVQYKIPKKFPFDVKDKYSENGTIELKREYLDELIKVDVDLAANESDEDESDSDSSSSSNSDHDKDKDGDSISNTSSDNDSESNTSSDKESESNNAKSAKSDNNSDDSDDSDGDDRVSIPLYVNVSKGSNISMDLYVYAFPDEISIEDLALKKSKGGVEAEKSFYEGPELRLSDNVKEALHKYLEVRGIDASMANILHQYWNHKQSRDRTIWLKKLKKFIKNKK